VAANFTYANRGVAGAVVAVPGAAFVGGHPIGAEAVVVRPEFAARAQVGAFAGVAPQREAVVGGRPATTFVPPAAAMNRSVVTRVAPPPAPVPFARQAAALQANQGRPLAPAAVAQIRAQSPPPQRVNFRPATPGGAPGGTNTGTNAGANAGGAAASRPAFGNAPVNNGLTRPATVGGQPGGQTGGQPGGQVGNPQPVARPATPATTPTPTPTPAAHPTTPPTPTPAEHPAARSTTHPPAKDTKKTQKHTEKEKEKP
jgi:hypothetical protein